MRNMKNQETMKTLENNQKIDQEKEKIVEIRKEKTNVS